MIRAILHLLNDQPLIAELFVDPKASDAAVICTNLRTIDGKKPVFIDFANSTFAFPMAAIRFIEVLRTGEDGERLPAVSHEEAPEPEDLEIDEDFLRRVREA